MTTKDAFTDEEWTRIVRAPFVAGLAISLADPGGPIEAAKETMATFKSATNPTSREELLAEVALDVQSMAQQKKHPSRATSLRRAVRSRPDSAPRRKLVAAKATPEESAAFGAWLMASAQAAAEAAKDGGFMGFHAQRVSDGEQAMLDQVRKAVSD